jgi:hypothetical protein
MFLFDNFCRFALLHVGDFFNISIKNSYFKIYLKNMFFASSIKEVEAG